MNKISKNLIWGFGGQFLGLALSIVLPRLILINFGSEANGICSTITQIFGYMALLEAGIGSAALTCLYKNIANHDRKGISSTVSAARKYYINMLPLYIGGVVILAGFYSALIDTTIPTKTVQLLILAQGFCGIINFLFVNTYIQLLTADGRNYLVSIFTLMVKFISILGQILLIEVGFDIASIQLAVIAAYILQALAINLYIKRHYPWLVIDKKADISILKQRRSFVVHEISGVVFQSTDLVLISIFCSITDASIYAVYNMIFTALGNLLSILMRAVEFKLGTTYHQEMQRYMKMHDFVESLYICLVFAVISAAYVFTLPFVALYTAGVTDGEYLQPILPLLFSAIQLLSCGRRVSSQLIAISGNAKKTIPNTLIEMIINISASLLLVNLLGVIGVLLGTIIALLYRTNDIVLYANRKILFRSAKKTYLVLLRNGVIFAVILAVSQKIPWHVDSYFVFLYKGFLMFILSLIIYFGTHIIVDRSFREYLKTALTK